MGGDVDSSYLHFSLLISFCVTISLKVAKKYMLQITIAENRVWTSAEKRKMRSVAKKRYQAVGFPCNRMLELSSSRGIRIDIPVLSVSWSFEDHSVIIQARRKGLIEHEASDTGGVPRWQSSCPDRLAEATGPTRKITYSGVLYRLEPGSLDF